MKKVILYFLFVSIILIMPVMLLCGCAKDVETIPNEENLFVCVDRFVVYQGYDYVVLVNKKTRVMYLTQVQGGMVVMLNADGTPMLWEGEL